MSQPLKKSSQAQLVTLVPELFERIAEDPSLKAQDLCNLRLVSREGAKKVWHSYKQVCFHTRTIVLAKPATITSAITIVKHEKLGPAIKKMRVYMDMLDEEKEKKHGIEHGQYYSASLIAKLFTFLEPSTGLREITIEICQMVHGDTIPRSVSQAEFKKAKSPGLKGLDHVAQVAGPLWEGSVKVTNLIIGQGTWMLPMDYSMHFGKKIRPLFQSLRHLSLGYSTPKGRPPQLAWARDMAALIGCATQLETLHLRAVIDLDVHTPHNDFLLQCLNDQAHHFPKLRFLHLDGLRFMFGQLIMFINRHGKLSKFKSKGCVMEVVGDEVEEECTLAEGLDEHTHLERKQMEWDGDSYCV